MLRGDGGEIWIRGRRAARVASWTMRPGGGGVSIEVETTGKIPALWLTPPLPPRAKVRLQRRATGYDLWFRGDLALADARRVILHRCEECSKDDDVSGARGAAVSAVASD